MDDAASDTYQSDASARRMVILTEGNSEPIAAKTAVSVLRYRPEQVVALLDSTQIGKTARHVFHLDSDAPFVATLDAAPEADTLMLGIAPPGGRLPASWREVILEAISRKMDVVSGLHEFLVDDAEFVAAAKTYGTRLVDVRKNDEHDVANVQGLRHDCLRIHTVGQDCCVGKMVVSIEISRALNRAGHDSKFVATGQTGILIEGDGCPIDCVVSDFLSGAIEKQILANQHHDILLIEGQGSIAHPRYSAVTLGLLHGCRPQGLILCYEAGRTAVHSMEPIPLKPLSQLCETYETLANLMAPCELIGVAMNSRRLGADEAEEERERVRQELGLPVCDVVRHGPDELVEAVLRLKPQLAIL